MAGIVLVAVAAALSLLAPPAAAQKTSVSICADPDPPPWSFWVRDAQGNRTPVISGFSIDLMNDAFQRMNLQVVWIGDYPWARCMKQVEAGEVDFALGAYFNDTRAQTFAYTRPYSTLTPQVFYRRQRPIVVRSKADLKRYQGCGMIGASYAHYGLGPKDLDSGVNTYVKLITKLKVGRCDFFVEELEIVAGHKALGRDLLSDPDLAHGPVPDAEAPAHHLIAAKGSAAAALIPELNQTLERLIRGGDAAKHWRRYAKDLPYKP